MAKYVPLEQATRQDTWRLNVHIENLNTRDMEDFGIWDKKTGGEVDSEDNIYHPGGMEDAISLGGLRSTGNVTLQRLYKLNRDHGTGSSGRGVQALFNRAGKAKIKIAQHPMDINGHIFGNPIVYMGKLKRVAVPDVDSEASGAALIEIEASIQGFPTRPVS
jgi:hypothetical protein